MSEEQRPPSSEALEGGRASEPVGGSLHAPPAANASAAPACDACRGCADVCAASDCVPCGVKRGSARCASGVFTRCQVRRHVHETDCWLVAHGAVYDASAFVDSHPGGRRSILTHAGQPDSSEDYDFHSAAGRKLWETMRIGEAQLNLVCKEEERTGGTALANPFAFVRRAPHVQAPLLLALSKRRLRAAVAYLEVWWLWRTTRAARRFRALLPASAA
jgi:hypothetical protein